MKLHIGCGSDLKQGYVNIDVHSKEDISHRYKRELPPDIPIFNYDIFHLPFDNCSVDEVICLGMLEHLSFVDEGRFFREMQRVLKPGGTFHFSVPDFEVACKQFLEAKDDFKGFYKVGVEEDWFGQGNRDMSQRWGYLTAVFFGNQNGQGQFHRNAYTVGKIRSILRLMCFVEDEITFPKWGGTDTYMIDCKCHKA